MKKVKKESPKAITKQPTLKPETQGKRIKMITDIDMEELDRSEIEMELKDLEKLTKKAGKPSNNNNLGIMYSKQLKPYLMNLQAMKE